MKKIFIYASTIALSIGAVAYFLINRKNKNKCSKKQVSGHDFDDLKHNDSNEMSGYEPDTAEKMENVKDSSINSIGSRHIEAADIMRKAFEDIYEDIGDVESDENGKNIVDYNDIKSSINNEKLNLISNELDDLLK